MIQAGFIGCGNMGGALAAAAAKSGARVLGADHNGDKLERLRRDRGLIPSTAEEIARTCGYIFLGVKPQVMAAAAAELWEPLTERRDRCVIVSMAAGLTADTVSQMLDGAPVIRIMPNTPCAVGEGAVLWCRGQGVTDEDCEGFLSLMAPAGLLLPMEESRIDAASALSGCGPAFVCQFIEGLIDGGVRCGLPRAKAEQLALQTVLGTARLALETGRDPALLRGDVCSPGGSTIEGVAVLENRALRGGVMEAVTAAYRRTKELGNR